MFLIRNSDWYFGKGRRFIIFTIARKSGEYVVIGENIVVKVISNDKEELQLAIEAPKGINIKPGEMSKAAQQSVSSLNDKEDIRQVIDQIAVWKENSIVLIDPAMILYFTMDKKRVLIYTNYGIFESNNSLEYLEGRLSNRGFFRCHKSFVINMDHVDKIVPWFNSTYLVNLKAAAEPIPVSRHYAKRLRSLLNI
ncbi:LytTR family transcriptional regulator DNA-binding domain-containing protein [Candidatus Desulfosporosinus nitrosoreducens]|uniref:LytTR family transcriptional regulator DNA-binding domain-containing protein n=1 Tax=Candidatus Desulfosporosinus nitrosoreducens TaxID=3401928 RepID=UPI0035AC18C0